MDQALRNGIIRPYRYIPFDIGLPIREQELEWIRAYLESQNAALDSIPILQKSISDDIVLKATVSDDICLYIYAYGVGVFTIRDDPYQITGERFAVEYCRERKQAHHSILKFQHRFSPILRGLIEGIRRVVRKSGKKARVRKTANEQWENQGISYVMTVSFIQSENFESNYSEMPEIEKRNLHILLEPSIAHAEDSLVVSIGPHKPDSDPYSFDMEQVEPQKNLIKSKGSGLYISWAAVVAYIGEGENDYLNLLESLEVDLQAMWLYTYCLNYDLRHTSPKEKRPASALKRDLFEFRRCYNGLLGRGDSSMPAYMSAVQEALIESSGIKTEKEKYIEYLQYCIDETESVDLEHQKKYSWLNEILLFLLAFLQIAPMAYHFLLGEYTGLVWWPIIVLTVFIVIGVIIIIRKE